MIHSNEWHALRREAALASAQIALGVTALGRADHARIGDYTVAFFSLAIGLERLGKLIVVTDHAIEHRGKFPNNAYLKKNISHDLSRLLDHCEAMSSRHPHSSSRAIWKRPNDTIHQEIIRTLDEFAKWTRYYNLDLVSGGEAAKWPEPVGAWWKRVGQPILLRHYTSRQRKKDRIIAKGLNEMMHAHVSVRLHFETGESMNDIAALLRHAGATRVVQKYGRLYVLQIVRWLSYMISAIAHKAAYTQRLEPFLELDEPFKLFLNDDHYLRTRKTWAIYP